jgi:hypothetical protein
MGHQGLSERVPRNALGSRGIEPPRVWLATHHRVHQFKLSNDPKFIDKLRDVVGLYVGVKSQEDWWR